MNQKSSLKPLKKKLDILWAVLVKLRAGSKCEICGKVTGLNSHHIVGRRVSALRWDVRNGCSLCVSCHRFSNNSAHNNGTLFDEWLKIHRPDDREYILKHCNDTFDKDYERIEENLRRRVENEQ